MRQIRWMIPALLTLVVGAATRADNVPIHQMVVFGDSLSDTGNLSAATGLPPALLNPFTVPYVTGGIPAAMLYDGGRFSNGPLWVEDLAQKLGLPAPMPRVLGGNNYAWAGAESGTNGGDPTQPPFLLDQVGQYRFLDHGTPTADTLFVVWSGGNDFRNNALLDPGTPVANIVTALTSLIDAGATHFLVPNLPLLGEIPETIGLPAPVRAFLDFQTLQFDMKLKTAVDQLATDRGVEIDLLDVQHLFAEIQAAPATFGFTNVTDAAIADDSLSGNGFLFWDNHHPSRQTGELIAERGFNAVAPAPASLWLLCTGGLGLL